MDKARITSIGDALRQNGLDAMILRLPENVVMATGVWPMNGFTYAVVTPEGAVACVAPSCEDEEMDGCWASDVRFFTWPRLDMPDPLKAIQNHLVDIAIKHGLTDSRIGYEGGFENVAPSHNAGECMVACEASGNYLKATLPDVLWSDATGLLNGLRSLKTDSEIARLRLAHQVASFGLDRFHQSVEPGISEAMLASLVYTECLTRGVAMPGVRHVNVYPQVSSGPNAHRAWRPIVTTGKRVLKHGEIAVLELAVCVDGFWADTTRVKVAGKPSDIQQRAFSAVKQAQEAAVQCIRPGVSASYPDKVARKILSESGFEKDIIHLTGHGVGFRYHEPEPFLVAGNDALKLKKGHVCSVEPGLYNPEWGGIRLEDNIAVTEEGVEVLTIAEKVI
jgi:Xaa-Pro aminopeptidase